MKKHKHKQFALKRELGLWQTTLCGIGIILGAGIYALIGEAAGIAGNATWLSFIVAAIIAAFTGLSYAELSSMFPKASAEYDYTKKSFGKRIGFLVGWMIIFAGVVSVATVTLGFGRYFGALFGTPVIIVSIIAVILMALINFWGIKQSTTVAIILTIIEAGGLIFIIFLGLPYIGSVDYFLMPAHAGLFNGMFSSVLAAAAIIFFAYLGFEDMVRLSEETKCPTKNIPKGLIIAIVITTIIYILVAVSAVSVLGWEKLAASKAPLADVASLALGSNAFLALTIAALFSTFNTALLLLIATSRIMYGMGKQKALPKILDRVHPKRRTPWIAIIITTILSVAFIFADDIRLVASITDFFIFILFVIINMSLIYLRYRSPRLKRGFRVPLNIGKMPVLPVLGIIFSLLLMVSLSYASIFYGIIIIIIGMIAYSLFIHPTKNR